MTRIAGIGIALAALMAVFGLPPVDLHGLAHYAGIMDPFCGGTRSVRLAARGDWSGSLRYNPIGIPVLLGGLAVLVRALVGWLAGRWLAVSAELVHRYPRVSAAVTGVLLVALEVNQQMHAELLLARR
ncbi:MAG TPA: DUF2752 domain-containing protein [Kineosporiaceae bacterium]|nr:DUF2752 domain-containing protein [Kineosporiaceae bacterium]